MYKHSSKAAILSIAALCCATATEAQQWLLDSPGKILSMKVSQSTSDGLAFSVTYEKGIIAEASSIGLTMADATVVGGQNVIESKADKHEGVMTTKLGEWSEHADDYTTLTLKCQQNSDKMDVELRVYDEGFAWRYTINRSSSVNISCDNAALKIKKKLTYWSEKGAESGYVEQTSSSTFTTLCPMFASDGNFSISVGEAGNNAIASQASLSVESGTVRFKQTASTSMSKMTTPWRVVMIGKTQATLQNAKYIMRSLNEETTDEGDWIVPGKVLRSLEEGTNDFHTDSVKNVIDFAERIGCKYVLLDAGWYGLGYSQEKNRLSVPTEPRPTLDIAEVIEHAKSKEMGILLYVNKVAWDNYSIENTLDTYSSWGAKGVKMGFVDGLTQSGMKTVYNVIEGCAAREMVVNVHDNYRPTGTERTWPNLLTVEGVRGDEHNPDAAHAMRLPFSRYMCGPADFTFVFRRPGDTTNRLRTRGQQLGLLVAFFSPLQHVLWYGRPFNYVGKEDQLEFIRRVPTTWDETVPLLGKFGEYVVTARRSGEKWYVGYATNSARTINVTLSFLTSGKKYDITTFEDDGKEGIKSRKMSGVTSTSQVSFDLLASGGAAAIIETASGDSSIHDIVESKNINIYSRDGKIEVSATGMATIGEVRVYSLSGIKLSAVNSNGSHATTSAPRGIVVVEVDSSEGTISRKVAVR